MSTMTPYLLWDENMRVAIHSLQELDQVIDQLVIQAQQKQPLSAQLAVNAERCLLITIGCEESHLEFYSKNAPTLASGCRGPWDDNTLAEVTV